MHLILSWVRDSRGSASALREAAECLPVRLNCASFSTQFPRDLLLAIADGNSSLTVGTLRALAEANLYSRVAADLTPWALGLRDPVAERVAVREERGLE